MKLSLNTAELRGFSEKAFRDTAMLLGNEFTKAISSSVWPWPNGETPRDIVDTGQLRRSQRIEWEARLTSFFVWSVEYAAAVHNGAILKSGGQLPARRWTDRAFNQFDVAATYSRLFRRYAR